MMGTYGRVRVVSAYGEYLWWIRVMGTYGGYLLWVIDILLVRVALRKLKFLLSVRGSPGSSVTQLPSQWISIRKSVRTRLSRRGPTSNH